MASLAALRTRIDALDRAMHLLLIERSEVIDSLIKIKGTSLPGAAFRPGREAQMMRALVQRHRGALPLTTVEHIWREIITTFTRMQAPFALTLEGGKNEARLRDLARFYFGFSVELTLARDAAAIVERIAATGTDLGLLSLTAKPGQGIWWRGLGGAGRPQVMTLLPFIKIADRPADTPALVISPPLSEAGAGELSVIAAELCSGTAQDLKASVDIGLLAEAEEAGQHEVLLVMPAAMAGASFVPLAASLGVGLARPRSLGTLSQGISIGMADLPFYRTLLPNEASQ